MDKLQFYNYLNVNYIVKKYEKSKPCLYVKHICENNYIEIIKFLLNYEYSQKVRNQSNEQ